MPDTPVPPGVLDATAATHRFRAGLRLHEIEGNPLSPDQIAMFEMFEREGWSPERRREHMRAKVTAARK